MVTACGNGRVSFAVRLTPKASRNAVTGWAADETNQPILKVSITTVPEKGKANQALIALLSKEWKIPKSLFVLEKGETDRNKILSVPEIYAKQILAQP